MKKVFLTFALVVLVYFSTCAQSLAFRPVYHVGQYTGGSMTPGWDYELSLEVPLTYKLSFDITYYFYNAHYRDYGPHMPLWFERYHYWSFGLVYTFSDTPLFK